MQFLLLVLGICGIIYLFTLFVISHDDYVLLRRNITTEMVFNMGILTILVGLFAARLFYAATHFSTHFLNILYFIMVPYYPGLSLKGGILGGMLFAYLWSRYKKRPLGRFLDFFAIALFASLPFGFFIYLFFITKVSILFALIVALSDEPRSD